MRVPEQMRLRGTCRSLAWWPITALWRAAYRRFWNQTTVALPID